MSKLALVFRTFVLTIVTLGAIAAPISAVAQPKRAEESQTVPKPILLQIIRAEDERRWDSTVADLLKHESASVRIRAALAAGRIGNELAVPALIPLLTNDNDYNVQSMAAFALGETEAASAGDALLAELGRRDPPPKARIIEALGKITAALPATDTARLEAFRKAIKSALQFEASRRSKPDREVISLGLTAALRARPEGVGQVVAAFLNHSDPTIRADAANTLARLRAKDGNAELRKLLTSDESPNVRANAARVLGVTEDKESYTALLDRATNDPDQRVRVSAIRTLATLRDQQATGPLLARGKILHAKKDQNELLEIVTAIGRLEQNSKSAAMIEWLKGLREYRAPEVEVALARVGPQLYQIELYTAPPESDWLAYAAQGQGAAELANIKTGDPLLDAMIKNDVVRNLSLQLSCFKSEQRPPITRRLPANDRLLTQVCAPLPQKAVPDWLRAFAAFKPKDLNELLLKYLQQRDVTIRAAAAELLADLPSSPANIQALDSALDVALRDRESNDAALAILDALAKQKNSTANEAIKSALDSSDYLVRRKALDSLKAAGAGDFSNRIGPVKSRNTSADYTRAVNRIGKRVEATVTTSKGAFILEMLPEKAPLTVDNFVQLAKRGYFNGIAFHRVVPNFVVQGGDPRGDGNGGPGYAIRCEINEVPYGRGALGMALSGKDTGGSQWFVTHSPQPHLDGGYTVFGRVIKGMDVVDSIVRGDTIRSIRISESAGVR